MVARVVPPSSFASGPQPPTEKGKLRCNERHKLRRQEKKVKIDQNEIPIHINRRTETKKERKPDRKSECDKEINEERAI